MCNLILSNTLLNNANYLYLIQSFVLFDNFIFDILLGRHIQNQCRLNNKLHKKENQMQYKAASYTGVVNYAKDTAKLMRWLYP